MNNYFEGMSQFEDDKQKIDASVNSEESKIYAFKRISKWFELDLTIKMFGHVVYHLHFPPNGDK